MATFKGIVFPDRVAPLVRHMHAVVDRREALAALSATWDTLALLAHLSNPKADMREVRASFGELTGELLVCLAEETLALADAALGHRAQIALELLTRSLSGHRAGIGLLASDPAIVEACVADDGAGLAALHERLRRHAAPSRSCSDIVLLAPDGQVLARLVAGFAGRSSSPLVARALSDEEAPVEACETTDFCNGERALTLACRVERDGRAVGVLAGVVDLEHEAAAIFERLATNDEVLAFVDDQGRIVVSNDAARLSPGRRLGLRPGAAALRLGGVTHLVAQRQGSGWSAVALAPVELAFGEDAPDRVPVDFSGETVLSQRLLDVPVRAREIQRRLDRMVWNGRIQQSAESNAFSRSLLEEIAATGRRTREQFERASSELLATVASSLLGEARLLAGLAVDLLARSRHERVDDEPPFEAVLRTAVPDRHGALAAFCRRDGAVIGRTGELPVTLPASVLALAPGQSWSGVLAEGADRFIVGAASGGGRNDDEPLIGVVVVPCGRAVDRHVAAVPEIANVAGGAEIATFLIGEHLLGVPAHDVVECIAATAAVRVWRGGFAQRHVGFVTWNDMALPLVDIGADLNASGAARRHALVLEAGTQRFGLLVSELGPVADMQLTEERGLAGRHDASRLITQLARSGPVFIPVLSPEAIFGGPAG
jgi:chemotaxis signal transduction protein